MPDAPTAPPPPAGATRLDGATVAVVGGGPLAEELRAGLEALGATIEAGLAGEGPLDAAVFAPWDPAELRPSPFAELTDEAFGAAWQRTMDDAVELCTTAKRRFGATGGRIVLTCPTVALAGGARHAHWAAAAEGVHLLAKSAARQWGPEGTTVNVLAVGPERTLAEPATAGPVSIATPALGRAEPVAACAVLCSPAASTFTGQTVVVDGGLWM